MNKFKREILNILSNMENNNICVICHENIENDKYTLECGHSYHCKCIMTWFRNKHDNCPLCNDKNLFTRLKKIRSHGINEKNFNIDHWGFNSRLDEIQSAILSSHRLTIRSPQHPSSP